MTALQILIGPKVTENKDIKFERKQFRTLLARFAPMVLHAIMKNIDELIGEVQCREDPSRL